MKMRLKVERFKIEGWKVGRSKVGSWNLGMGKREMEIVNREWKLGNWKLEIAYWKNGIVNGGKREVEIMGVMKLVTCTESQKNRPRAAPS